MYSFATTLFQVPYNFIFLITLVRTEVTLQSRFTFLRHDDVTFYYVTIASAMLFLNNIFLVAFASWFVSWLILYYLTTTLFKVPQNLIPIDTRRRKNAATQLFLRRDVVPPYHGAVTTLQKRR